jgi:drug/metabolite transporter (DMT)-like permease
MAGAVMISFAPVFVRLVDVSPTASAFYRTFLGGIILVAWVAMARSGAGPRSRGAVFALVAAGLLFAGDLAVWHRSIWYVGPGLATLLANFQVLILAVVGVIALKERARWQLLVAIPMALAGLGLIVGFDWSTLPGDYRWGVAFGLLTAVFYSAYILALRRARRLGAGGSPAADLVLVSFVSAAALGVGAAGTGESLAVPTLRDGGLLAAYALVAQVMGWILISGGLPRVPASRVGLILLTQPTLAFVWDVLIFSRPFTAREAAGAALAIVAIGLGAQAGRSAQHSEGPGDDLDGQPGRPE